VWGPCRCCRGCCCCLEAACRTAALLLRLALLLLGLQGGVILVGDDRRWCQEGTKG
jgi:hypothetical protein